jgi:hypothetical protein
MMENGGGWMEELEEEVDEEPGRMRRRKERKIRAET